MQRKPQHGHHHGEQQTGGEPKHEHARGCARQHSAQRGAEKCTQHTPAHADKHKKQHEQAAPIEPRAALCAFLPTLLRGRGQGLARDARRDLLYRGL